MHKPEPADDQFELGNTIRIRIIAFHMLTIYETFLTFFSAAVAGLSFIALAAFLVITFINRWKRWSRGYVERKLAGMEMKVDGFTFEEVVREEDYAGDVVSKHPAGGKVRVFYDPADPGESVIHLQGGGPNLLHQILQSLAFMPALLVLTFFVHVNGVVRSARRRLKLERSRRA